MDRIKAAARVVAKEAPSPLPTTAINRTQDLVFCMSLVGESTHGSTDGLPHHPVFYLDFIIFAVSYR